MQLKRYGIAVLLLTAGVVPAQAFDCAKAESPVEKAICADPKLKAADDAMGAVYTTLRTALTGGDRKALGASQRKWVKTREDNCGYQQGAELTNCILTDTKDRRRCSPPSPKAVPARAAFWRRSSSNRMPIRIITISITR